MTAIASVFADPMLMSSIYSFDYTYHDIFVDVVEEIECEISNGKKRIQINNFNKKATKNSVGLLNEDIKYKVGTIFKCASDYYEVGYYYIITKVGRKYYYGRRFQYSVDIKNHCAIVFETKSYTYLKDDMQFDKEGYKMRRY